MASSGPDLNWWEIAKSIGIGLSGATGLVTGAWVLLTKRTETKSSEKQQVTQIQSTEAEQLRLAGDRLREQWEEAVKGLREEARLDRKEHEESLKAINARLDIERDERAKTALENVGLRGENLALEKNLVDFQTTIKKMEDTIAKSTEDAKTQIANCHAELLLRDGLITKMRMRINAQTVYIQLIAGLNTGKWPPFDLPPLDGEIETPIQQAAAELAEAENVTLPQQQPPPPLHPMVAVPGGGRVVVPEGAVLVPQWQAGETVTQEMVDKAHEDAVNAGAATGVEKEKK